MINKSNIKSDLKKLLRDHLEKRVSAMFLEQSLVVIDQSANNKESFTVAADRVSKRIALFIDNDLSQTVYNSLLTLIGATASPQGKRRRFPRVDFHQNVAVKYNRKQYELISENISEGGILLKADELFPINAHVELFLSLEAGRSTAVQGTVVVNSKNSTRGGSRGIKGMGIEFKEVDTATAELLRKYVEKHSTD